MLNIISSTSTTLEHFVRFQILTATVETVSEIDLGPILSGGDRRAVARAVTITDSDTGKKSTNRFVSFCPKGTKHIFVNTFSAMATAQIQATQLMGDGDGEGDADDTRDIWVTTVGKFRFLIEELPPFLQFTYELLKVIFDTDD